MCSVKEESKRKRPKGKIETEENKKNSISCLPNNLPQEESDQPRQKTRLTVPDCAVKEISSLTE